MPITMKEDRYEFPLNEWEYKTEPEPFEFPNPTKLILTRKKPKVKVDYRPWSGAPYGRIQVFEYGAYHLVQFRVTGWDGWDGDKAVYCLPRAMISHRHTLSRLEHGITQMGEIVIGLDARDKFSCPVLLPEEVYSRLPEICAALEQKANQGG